MGGDAGAESQSRRTGHGDSSEVHTKCSVTVWRGQVPFVAWSHGWYLEVTVTVVVVVVGDQKRQVTRTQAHAQPSTVPCALYHPLLYALVLSIADAVWRPYLYLLQRLGWVHCVCVCAPC